ncbi:MAG: hypothetical protein CMO16_04680 [Thaumarchaeota archaeon]|nr:hypothetical protein [Nitrososphaerota archaeon]|tara:strand:+ start:1444 stop:2064 length:621 start_codon:yes stop_codon:yes gene_type:complete
MFAADFESERANSIDDYKITCIQFIEDISSDYKDWVDRYNLSKEENTTRKKSIDKVVETTNEWIGKYGNTIKKIDIIKDDGINKMAEFTAGFPFNFDIFIEDQSRYVFTPAGKIKLNVKAKPRDKRKIRITYWIKEQFVQLLSSCLASVDIDQIDFRPKDVLDECIMLDISSCKTTEIISITITAEEVSDNFGGDKRGLTTLIRIK